MLDLRVDPCRLIFRWETFKPCSEFQVIKSTLTLQTSIMRWYEKVSVSLLVDWLVRKIFHGAYRAKLPGCGNALDCR